MLTRFFNFSWDFGSRHFVVDWAWLALVTLGIDLAVLCTGDAAFGKPQVVIAVTSVLFAISVCGQVSQERYRRLIRQKP